MKKRILAILLVLWIAGGSLLCYAESATEAEAAFDLHVFILDRCGGCGVDNPGCGNCTDTGLYHTNIKNQLGDRLYDGSMNYRIFNCRYTDNVKLYQENYEKYGVYADLKGYLPTIFIGKDGVGVFLYGVPAFDVVGQAVEDYESGKDLAEIQAWIDEYCTTSMEAAQEALNQQYQD